MNDAGCFIVFEGIDGCGKSTQAKLLAENLSGLLTHQPGGTPLGAEIRRLLLNSKDAPISGDMDSRAETLLMAADRAQHVSEAIRPAMAAGQHVVCDRYSGSSVAYQGYGRGLEPDEVAQISQWATDGLAPDLVILLDLAVEESFSRSDSSPDRIESAGAEFQARVRAGFLKQAINRPRRWAVIEAGGSVAEVSQRVNAVVNDRLGL